MRQMGRRGAVVLGVTGLVTPLALALGTAPAQAASSCTASTGPYQKKVEKFLGRPADGRQSAADCKAIKAFQSKHGLTADGVLGPATWAALLRYKPIHVDWSLDRRLAAGTQLRAAAASLREGGSPTVTLPVPLSAADPARRNEIPGSLGAGR